MQRKIICNHIQDSMLYRKRESRKVQLTTFTTNDRMWNTGYYSIAIIGSSKELSIWTLENSVQAKEALHGLGNWFVTVEVLENTEWNWIVVSEKMNHIRWKVGCNRRILGYERKKQSLLHGLNSEDFQVTCKLLDMLFMNCWDCSAYDVHLFF